jgi:hypothetical protein
VLGVGDDAAPRVGVHGVEAARAQDGREQARRELLAVGDDEVLEERARAVAYGQRAQVRVEFAARRFERGGEVGRLRAAEQRAGHLGVAREVFRERGGGFARAPPGGRVRGVEQGVGEAAHGGDDDDRARGRVAADEFADAREGPRVGDRRAAELHDGGRFGHLQRYLGAGRSKTPSITPAYGGYKFSGKDTRPRRFRQSPARVEGESGVRLSVPGGGINTEFTEFTEFTEEDNLLLCVLCALCVETSPRDTQQQSDLARPPSSE